MNKTFGFLFILLCIGSLNISAQDVWSLEKCILHAHTASIDIQQSRIGISQADLSLSQSQQRRLPTLNGSTGANWNFGRTVDPTTNEFITNTFFANNTSLSSGVTLFSGGSINNSIKQSKLDLEAAESDTKQLERDIALMVASRYLNVLFAQENIAISERQLQLSQQQLDQMNQLIEAGARAESEKLNLEAQIAQSEQALIVSRNTLDISMLQLKQVLRLDPSYPLNVEMPEGVSIATDPDEIRFEDAFVEAKKNRPDLYSSELRIQSAEYGVKIAKSSFTPRVSAGGSLGSAYSNQAREITNITQTTAINNAVINSSDPSFPYTDLPVEISTPSFDIETGKPSYGTQIDNNLSYGFGVSVSIPIYNQGSTRTSVQRAKLNAESAQLNFDNLVETLKLTVQQSLADAKAAKKKLEASEKTVTAQQRVFDNTTKQLEIGSSNTFEWESQKTQLENAEIQQLIDKYDYLFKIKILEFYLGKPMKLR